MRLASATMSVATLGPEEIHADAEGAPVWGPTAVHFAKQWAMKYDIIAVQEHRLQWEGVSALGQYSIAVSSATSRGMLGRAVLWKNEEWELLMHESAGPRATTVVLRRRRGAIAVPVAWCRAG